MFFFRPFSLPLVRQIDIMLGTSLLRFLRLGLLIGIFSLLNFVGFTQLDEVKSLIGPTVSIDWGHRFLSNPLDNESSALKDLKNESEFGAIGYSYGAHFTHFPSPKVAFSIGAKQTVRGYDGHGPITNQGVQSTDANVRNFYYYNFLDIPIGVHYYIHQAATSYFVGINTTYARLNKIEHRSVIQQGGITSDTSVDVPVSSFEQHNLFLSISGGLQYVRGERFIFRFEPFVGAVVNSVRKEPFKEHLYSVGLQLGVLYVLK